MKSRAQRLQELGLHFTTITPVFEEVTDKKGNTEKVWTVGKKPTIAGWPDAALNDVVAPAEFPADCNIGILLGTPVERDGITYYPTDIDIDKGHTTPIFKATFAAFDLPQAESWGRPGKPDSHHLLLGDKPHASVGSQALYHGIAEFRCQTKGGDYAPNGHQSITYPSIWCDGVSYQQIRPEPDSAPEPPIVSTDLLFEAYQTAVAVALIAPLIPEHPRHDIRCAFYRVLSKGGMSRQKAIRFMTLVDQFTTNPERNAGKLKDEALDIFRNLEADKPEKRSLYGVPFILSHIGESNRTILDHVLELLNLDRPNNSAQHHADAGLPTGFSISNSGVFFMREAGEDDEEAPKPFKVCSKLEVVSLVRTKDTEEWSLELKWTDLSNTVCTQIFARSQLSNDATAVREELLSRGFPYIDPTKRGKELFVRYLMGCAPAKRKHAVSRVGWHGESYVTPNRVFTNTNEELLFQSQNARRTCHQSGTVEQWQQNVSSLCVNNSRLVFAASIAFAAPLMHSVGAESGGVNLFGTSSIGKSTTGYVQASVMSDEKYIQRWRATANGLEGVAAQYNHSVLPLDEIAEADPREIGTIVYTIGNGRGKTRMTRSGAVRDPYEWQLLFFSTAEKDLPTHMHEGKAKVKGGQMVRCLDIPADAEKGFGLFEDLHGYSDGDAFSRTLRRNTADYHGTAFPAFMNAILKQGLSEVKGSVRSDIERFERMVRIPGSSGEVSRAINRFALIAAAGEIASSLGITGWSKDESFNAAKKCFEAWLKHRGGVGAGDITHGIRQVRRFLELHGTSRFSEINDTFERTVSNRAGFREHVIGQHSNDYFVFSEVFRAEVCCGYDATIIARALSERGVLVKEGRQLTVKKKLPGMDRPRVYHITNKIFDLED